MLSLIRNKLGTFSIIWALSIFLNFPTKSTADYRYHICSNTTSFIPNSTYQSNLNLLLSSLTSAPASSGVFYNTTAGTDDTAYGSFLCRGDLSPQECQSCVEAAASDSVKLYCPVEKVAYLWYDDCTLRYSNQSFFGRMTRFPSSYLWNIDNITDPNGNFTQLLANTMRDVVEAAATTDNKFATREANFSDFESLYSTAQCTPDISEVDCNICLGEAVRLLPQCCAGKRGGRVLFPSCSIRFEVYLFYKQTRAPPPNATPPIVSPPPLSPESDSRSRGGGKITATTIIAIAVPVVVAFLLIPMCWYYMKRQQQRVEYNVVHTDPNGGNDITTVESLQYELGTIQAATNNFSGDNKIGEGGFGTVYKGMLSTGQEIAVKRLSKNSLQGIGEFKNEVVLVAKLQHRNLTRLLGFCFEGEEKLLVYEFVPNKSLDNFLFDSPGDSEPLDWSRRYKIIGGIARGILYLHEDSRLRIIHRDLKASNVLLDEQMNPKISDFGMAKLCGVDETHGNTSRIVGTYGYMSPEYAFYGQFSVKSDVFSFGVLIIEIVTGKKSTKFLNTDDSAEDLLSFTWKHWRNGTPAELLDPRLGDSYTANEVTRCVHIGLLCVQEDPDDRPTMATIVLMLSSYSVSLPLPKQPAFFPHTRTGEICLK